MTTKEQIKEILKGHLLKEPFMLDGEYSSRSEYITNKLMDCFNKLYEVNGYDENGNPIKYTIG